MSKKSNIQIKKISTLREIAPPVFYYKGDKHVRYKKKNSNLPIFDLSEGVHPFGPPHQYLEIEEKLHKNRNFLKAVSGYGAVDDNISEVFIQKRFGKIPYIYLSGGGSDEILERIVSQVIKYPERKSVSIIATGPTYTHVFNFAGRFGYARNGELLMKYKNIVKPLNSKLVQLIEEITIYAKKGINKNILIYVCNPSTPTGESIDLRLIEALAEVSSRKGHLLLIDEAFGDFLPDDQSAIPLTNKYPNLIVTRSVSKGIGLPGLRFGYAAMSGQVGKMFDEIRRVVDISGPQLLIANEILNPEIILPYLKEVRIKTKNLKAKFISELIKSGVSILPTDNRIPIMVIDGKNESFYERLLDLNVVTASGSGFVPTHPEMSNRYIRMTIPSDIEDIPELVSRISMAKAA